MAAVVSEYRRNKYSDFFKFLDIQNRGFITISDFVESIMNLKVGGGTTDQRYMACRKEMLSWWALYHDDAELNDGKIDHDTFMRLNIDYFANQENSANLKQYFGTMFNYIDKNKDGEISQDEYMAYYKAHNWTDEDHIREIFRRLDLDKDDSISKAEFVSAGLYFFLSDDPENGFGFLFRPPRKT